VLQWAWQNGCDWSDFACAVQHRGVTWRYCSGPEVMAALCTTQHAYVLLLVVT
jgi:hypothetical protein